MTLEAAVLWLFAGDVIATLGTLPRVTLTLEGLLAPKAFVQTRVIVFAPTESEKLFVLALPDATALSVQVVPPGIVALPLTV